MAVRYDTQKLKTDISIQSACAIAGIPVSRNGFIKCPDHLKNMGKPDKKATNCKIYPHSYVCYACGAKGDIFSLVKGYKESYEGELLSFSDTAKMLAEGSGNEKEYILSMSDIEEKSMDFFPIPDEVLSFCGIMTRVIPLSCPECMAYNKSDIPSNMEAVACPSSDSDSPVDDFYVGYSYRGAYGIKNLYSSRSSLD